MKLATITALAAMSLSLLGCEEKKPEVKPTPTDAAAPPATATLTTTPAAAGASAKPAGGW
jgi:uncharacterized lipoprotein NlpE involved in copper resistance